MSSHANTPSPPGALLSLDDRLALDAFAAVEEHLKMLRLQHSLLLIANLFERFPATQTVGFNIETIDNPPRVSEAHALSNRSSRYLFNFADPYLSKRIKPDPAFVFTPEDQEAEFLLHSICQRLIQDNETRLHRIVFTRSESEPLVSSVMRAGLPPDLFPAWERSRLAADCPPEPSSSRPPRASSSI